MAEDNNEPGDIVLCPSCQKIWPKGTKFCTQCGTWIDTGQVMEPRKSEQPEPPGPRPSAPPSQGASPPGIRPSGVPAQGPSPPGITPTPPAMGVGPAGGVLSQGPSPPETPPSEPAQPSGDAGRSAGDARVEPTATPTGAEKKYKFKTEPVREERLPSSPAFVPKREPKKHKGSTARQVIVVIIALLLIAYATISLAFKPLHRFLVGTFFETIGWSRTAVKFFEKGAKDDSSWAEKSQRAMNKIGKEVFIRHIELQYASSWTASSTIRIRPPAGEVGEFESEIEYKAPGDVRELITGAARGGRMLNDTRYVYELAGARLSAGFEQYADVMRDRVGFGPDTLFEASGKDEVIEVFFDELETELSSVSGSGDETIYEFIIRIDGDSKLDEKLQLLSGPFFPWSVVIGRYDKEVERVELDIRAKDGFLSRIGYYTESGTVSISQEFEDFEPGED
jgi:hypothetical protein